MRFGISLISWMLPKILRIRRWLVFAPPEALRGASIALVAMIVPALLGAGDVSPYPGWSPAHAGTWMSERVSRFLLPNAFDPCAVRGLSRGGQEKPRAHVTVRGGVYVLEGADIVIFRRRARGLPLRRLRYGWERSGSQSLPAPERLCLGFADALRFHRLVAHEVLQHAVQGAPVAEHDAATAADVVEVLHCCRDQRAIAGQACRAVGEFGPGGGPTHHQTVEALAHRFQRRFVVSKRQQLVEVLAHLPG